MFGILAIAASLVITWFGYTAARKFVRDRLRFVDAAQSGWAPILAGVGASLVATPLAALIPLIGSGTAIAFVRCRSWATPGLSGAPFNVVPAGK